MPWRWLGPLALAALTAQYSRTAISPSALAAATALHDCAAGSPSVQAAGLDFSGVDHFWPIAAELSRDVEPTEAEWQALLDTPGYRLAAESLGPGLRDAIDLALKPSRREERERSLTAGDDRALALKHLALAWEQRADLIAFRDSLARASVIAQAVAIAAESLPAGATLHGPPPPVAVALFLDDGYSLADGIVIDLLNVRHVPLARNLAHEFHHSFVNRLARPLPSGSDTAYDAGFRVALYDLRNEGLADLIDKPYPFASPNPGLAGYATRYNQEYRRTPERLTRLDSLLVRASAGPEDAAALARPARMLFWSNGHPNGAYMAREIQETFGVDSLRTAALDPAAFLRIYAAAERRRGHPEPLSSTAWKVIDALDAKYWRR